MGTGRKKGKSYHLPELVRARELQTCSFHYEGLFLHRPVLELELDIGKPWPGASGMPLDILFVEEIIFSLLEWLAWSITWGSH